MFFSKEHSLVKHAAMIGGFAVILFAVCVAWSLFITDPAVEQFHLLSLKLTFPGFRNFDAVSILWGAILSFVYGFIASIIWHSIHKNCCKG